MATQNVTVNGGDTVHIGIVQSGRPVATLCSNAVYTTAGNVQVRREFRACYRGVTCGLCLRAQKARDNQESKGNEVTTIEPARRAQKVERFRSGDRVKTVRGYVGHVVAVYGLSYPRYVLDNGLTYDVRELTRAERKPSSVKLCACGNVHPADAVRAVSRFTPGATEYRADGSVELYPTRELAQRAVCPHWAA